MTGRDEPGRQIRWGIAATGAIAHAFASDLKLLPDARLVAVGSRTRFTAEAFAARHELDRCHDSYEGLAADPEVDVVYIATPHPAHHVAARVAIDAGKAVLVEKPFTMDAEQAQDLIDAARARSTFLMEAMWTRFLPHVRRIREILAAGVLGEVVSLTAEHAERFAPDSASRLFSPALGGGALLDLGIYPVSFAHLVLGPPQHVAAVSSPARTGVDATTSMIFRYSRGAHAVLTTSLAARSANRASINGSDARTEIDGPFYAPTTFRVISPGENVLEHFTNLVSGSGLRYEAAEVGRCLRSGMIESPLLPLDETLSVMKTMDEIRRQIGLVYQSQ